MGIKLSQMTKKNCGKKTSQENNTIISHMPHLKKR
jgi:hypothetical protein